MLSAALYRWFVRAEHDDRARALLVGASKAWMRALVAEHARGGSRLFDMSRRALVRFGAYRGPRLRERLGLDGGDMADLGRAQDFEDRAFGVVGTWTERRHDAATKCETECPFAAVAREMPAICTDLVHALETETFRAIDPSYRLLPIERLLSKGDDACEFRHVRGG